MSVLNVIANVVGIASIATVLSDNFHHMLSSDNFHHMLSSAQIKFISLSFSLVRQLLTFANSSDCMRGSKEDATFVYNGFGTIRTLRMS